MATEPAPNADAVSHDTIPALLGPLFVATPALPAPKATEPVKNRATTSALQAFAAQIQAGDLLAAGEGRSAGAMARITSFDFSHLAPDLLLTRQAKLSIRALTSWANRRKKLSMYSAGSSFSSPTRGETPGRRSKNALVRDD